MRWRRVVSPTRKPHISHPGRFGSDPRQLDVRGIVRRRSIASDFFVWLLTGCVEFRTP
jgi:hypothetical protein